MAPQKKGAASRTANPSRRGKSKQQKEHAQSSSTLSAPHVPHAVSAEIQQSILDVFTQAFPVVSHQDDFKTLIQEVKGHLYDRDFTTAFGKQQYLDVYAARWSAARALAYANIFTHPSRYTWFRASAASVQPSVEGRRASGLDVVVQHAKAGDDTQLSMPSVQLPADQSLITTTAEQVLTSESSLNIAPATGPVVKILCIGGGAGAEIVALAASSRHLRSCGANSDSRTSRYQSSHASLNGFIVHAIDIADWSEPVRKITTCLTSRPPLSQYASQAARDSNRGLLDTTSDGHFTVDFTQQDVLQASPPFWNEKLVDVSIVTIMFTLNEIFSVSLPRTTALLLSLTEFMATDAHLVVVDSPGSYSEIKLGKSSQPETSQSTKRYPMKWLLDHTLLDVAGQGKDARWIKVEGEDSKWFRIDDQLGLKYGVDLENCRYQIHVFQKLQ